VFESVLPTPGVDSPPPVGWGYGQVCTYLLMDMIVARRVAEKYVRRGPRAAGALRELLSRSRKNERASLLESAASSTI
jgi:hypothetical protein